MNRGLLVLLIVLGLVVGLWPLPMQAGAAQVFQLKGKSASAYFDSLDPTGCVLTSVFVFASDDSVKQAPGPAAVSSGPFVGIFQFDFCQETSLLEAFGFASLPAPDFQFKGQTSARLTTALDLFDSVSGSSLTAFVDLSWSGIGAAERSHYNSHFQGPGYVVNDGANGVFRFAAASGSVSAGGVNFISGEAIEGIIGVSKAGSVFVTTGSGQTQP